MTDNYCGRWIDRSGCFLAECQEADGCQFDGFDQATNKVFLEAVEEQSRPARPRLLDSDGSIQLCEQCNNDDGKAVEVSADSIRVRQIWAHNAFGTGICRLVYMCDSCFYKLLDEAANGTEPWWGRDMGEMYGVHEDCAECQAHGGC